MKTILIVDDIQDNIDALTTLLKRRYNTLSTNNPTNTLDILKKNKVDMILLDVIMPELNGFEVCQKIKDNPLTNAIPVIFTTSIDDESSIEKAYDLGGVDYITKPFRPKEILSKIATHISIYEQTKSQANLIDELLSIGTSLTSENDFDILMEKIMLGAKKFASADAGTIYLLSDDKKELRFEVVHTDSLDIKMGGTGEKLNWPNLQLYIDGKPNYTMVAAKCALDMKLLNFADVYNEDGFNFEGTKVFDSTTGYRSTSMLVVPMIDRNGKLVGVLQLLNKIGKNGKIIQFNREDEIILSSMASLGAVSIHNHKLIESFDALLHSFITTIADTLEEKSAYTEHHIVRVAKITNTIIEAVNQDNTIFKDKHYNEDELDEINLAALLHDIGKIIQPEYVVDKSTRLETIFDRIELVKSKFQILRQSKRIEYLEKIISKEQYKKDIEKIDDDEKFLIKCNSAPYIDDQEIQRLVQIASQKITISGEEINFLSDDELFNLSIKKGTLTDDERAVINNHVTVSYNMLKNLPFPDKYKKIPKLAGSHHKSVDGQSGYAAPELMGLPLEFEERVLAIADVFEALTSPERPYKKPYSINESLKIISYMVKDGHLDKDIVKFMVDNKLYLKCGDGFIPDNQIDEITVEF